MNFGAGKGAHRRPSSSRLQRTPPFILPQSETEYGSRQRSVEVSSGSPSRLDKLSGVERGLEEKKQITQRERESQAVDALGRAVPTRATQVAAAAAAKREKRSSKEREKERYI